MAAGFAQQGAQEKFRLSTETPYALFPTLTSRICTWTFERMQFEAGALGLYAEKPHVCSALGAVRSFNRIRMR
jgi:hypothetical protein